MQSMTSLAVTLFVGLAAGASWRTYPTPTTTPSYTPTPTPSPATFPPLPSCVQPYIYSILRQSGCYYSETKDCICNKAYSALEQSIRQNCPLPSDWRSALGTLNNFCYSSSTPTPTPSPSPACKTTNPSLSNLPTCIQNCAIPIVREACGTYDNTCCTCQQRSAIYQCYRGHCSVDDQTCAGNIFDSLCGPNVFGATPVSGCTPTPTPKNH